MSACDLWRPSIANCVIWALVMQWRCGGYVCWRQSWHGWWPHAVWSSDGHTYYEYLPKHFAGRLMWWQVPRVLLFSGEPRRVARKVM